MSLVKIIQEFDKKENHTIDNEFDYDGSYVLSQELSKLYFWSQSGSSTFDNLNKSSNSFITKSFLYIYQKYF